MKCPKCHSENPKDTAYCGRCGTKLKAAAPISVTRTLETTPGGLGKGKLFAGRFELIEELGAGGMGIVYRAFDKEVGEEIALKVLHPDIVLDIGTATSFYQYRDLFGLNVWDDQILANNWDLETPWVNFTPNPQFMKAMNFYPPIAARLGARFSF